MEQLALLSPGIEFTVSQTTTCGCTTSIAFQTQ